MSKMGSPCIKQTTCKEMNIFHHVKHLLAYILKSPVLVSFLRKKIKSTAFLSISSAKNLYGAVGLSAVCDCDFS